MRKTVLVIDDERLIALPLAIILNKNGFNASPVYSGTTAMEAARRMLPEIAICDGLANADGPDWAICIKQFLPECRVLLFDSPYSLVVRAECAHAQGYDFEAIPKPTSPADLIEILRATPDKNVRSALKVFVHRSSHNEQGSIIHSLQWLAQDGKIKPERARLYEVEHAWAQTPFAC